MIVCVWLCGAFDLVCCGRFASDFRTYFVCCALWFECFCFAEMVLLILQCCFGFWLCLRVLVLIAIGCGCCVVYLNLSVVLFCMVADCL